MTMFWRVSIRMLFAALTLTWAGLAAAQVAEETRNDAPNAALLCDDQEVGRALAAKLESLAAENYPLRFGVISAREAIDSGLSSRYRLAIVGRMPIVPKALFGVLRDFAAGGGSLVVTGDFGRWTLAEGTKRNGSSESVELTGCKLVSGPAAVENVRVLTWNPVFREFKIGEWFPARGDDEATAFPMSLENAAAVPLAEAMYRPAGWRQAGFRYHYWDSRHRAVFRPWLTAFPVGAGVVSRFAERLTEKNLEPAFIQSVWRNLLYADAAEILKKRLPDFSPLFVSYQDGNLIPNGDFSLICPSLDPPLKENNNSKNYCSGPVVTPYNWRFNSWGGRYAGTLARGTTNPNDWRLTITKSGEVGGGALWQNDCSQVALIPGEKYAFSVDVRGTNVHQAHYGLTVFYQDGERRQIGFNLPLGTYAWRTVSNSLTIPPLSENGGVLRRGIVVTVSLAGGGELRIDNLTLKGEDHD